MGGIPVGMKFDPKQGNAVEEFMEPIANQLMRVLVRGGAFISFSQSCLFHRLAVAAENTGFEIRDMYIGHLTNRSHFKTFSIGSVG